MMQELSTVEQVAEYVRNQDRVRIVSGGTKTALSNSANVSLSGLSGVLQYEPSEFTFTARAGTRLEEVREMLAAKQQYLPFDPPLVNAGATLGGTVAAGISGAGRFRYGGVRDFLLGVQVVTGDGEIVVTGSKVVKNAAGFDFPKLMVGSLGKFGVMTELTFKVFPAPQSTATIVLDTENLAHAIELMNSLATSQLDVACLDMDSSNRIWVRLAGIRNSVELRTQRVTQFAGVGSTVLSDEEDLAHWDACREFQWLPEGNSLVKAAITPSQIADLASAFHGLPMQFSVGGHLVWLAWPEERSKQELNETLQKLGISAVALTGTWANPLVGKHTGQAFEQRLVSALDPAQKFTLLEPASV